jgi:hypothetical protein
MPLQDEERLFIEAIRDLNLQASRFQKEESQIIIAVIDRNDETETFENQDTPPSKLSRLEVLAVASELENQTSVTLDIAVTAAMEAAQKANNNLDRSRDEGPPFKVGSKRAFKKPLAEHEYR